MGQQAAVDAEQLAFLTVPEMACAEGVLDGVLELGYLGEQDCRDGLGVGFGQGDGGAVKAAARSQSLTF